MTIRTETITRGQRVGYLARPGEARAGVLLLPSVHGIDQYSKAYAQALAEAGLATVIWEPFAGSPPAETREQRAARLAPLTDATSLREMTWWLDLMTAELALTKIGTAGFCLGGRYGLLLVGARQPHRGLRVVLPDDRDAAVARPGRGRRGAGREHSLPGPHDPRRQGSSHQRRRVPAAAGQSPEPVGADDRAALSRRRPRLHAAHRRGERERRSIFRRRRRLRF